MTDRSLPMQIQASNELCAVTFTANGEHIVSGDSGGVRVWQVEDGRQVAAMELNYVWCVTVSNDGHWIAAGTYRGELCLWNATTYECVLKHSEDNQPIQGVEFSPDSTHLVSGSENCTAVVWDIASRTPSQTLRHQYRVRAARYSLGGDRIATGTFRCVCIWDSNDGTLLVDIPMGVTPLWNRGLVWFREHLFVVSDGKVKEIDASTWSTVHEWSSPDADNYQCIDVPQRGAFIACSARRTVTFWDTSEPSRTVPLGQIQHSQHISSVAFSPDGRFHAIGGGDGLITLQSLSRIVEPDFWIDTTALDAWKCNQFEDAESLLSTRINGRRIPNCHALACRALVRARLHKWDIALIDGEKAVKIRPSVISYVAKSMAHIGCGNRDEAYRACDIAVVHCHSSHATFLLLIKAIIVFIGGEYIDAISRMDDLITTTPLDPMCYVVRAYMLLLHGYIHMDSGNYDDAIMSFEHARIPPSLLPGEHLPLVSLISGWKFDDLRIAVRQGMCEALHSVGRTIDASDALLELVHTLDEEVYTCAAFSNWVSGFTRKCLSVQDIDATTLHTHSSPFLREWARATLINHSWKDALVTAVGFVTPRFVVYQAICEHLEATNHVRDATECFLDMMSEFAPKSDGECAKWILDIKYRLGRKLEEVGDEAMDRRQHDVAMAQYSTVLSLNPTNPRDLLIKRSKARAAVGWWRGALGDANDVIVLDPSSPLGYERQHAALRIAGRCGDADVAFETMLLRMSESSDLEIRARSLRYVRPTETESAIRAAVQTAIRDSPLVLINTDSGLLLDKPGQASLFESRLTFHELVCSMTTQIDRTRIEDEVGQYYRYATFSHKWKTNEPLYEDVIHVVVYDLDESPTHAKLQQFCKIVREAGFHWAWSDTVCINKADPSVLQEALVSMFQWYQSSTLTVVLLCDVPWKRLVNSIWNTRVWTFQEYHASKVVRFYNKDWTLYKDIDIPNHKNSPEIIAEMEEATGISAQALMALRPGLEDIREKLRLASTRQSTRIEDEAYSLLGIFSLSMPVVYGEGDRAIGKLLAQLLTSSGDTSTLAWNGNSGGFNSCLPSRISVFSEPPTSFIPSTPPSTQMEIVVTGLREASLNLASVRRFYDRLNDLPVPVFNGKRMKLPSISFKLGPVAMSRNGSERVFRAQASSLGIVEIRTKEDLLRFKSLTLVHPWIDFLLDRQPVGSMVPTVPEDNTGDQTSSQGERPSIPDPSNFSPSAPKARTGFAAGFGLPFGRRATLRSSEVVSLLPPSTVEQQDRELDAFRVLARLRQPFGALLLTPDHGNVAAYKRIATESLITVRVEEITPKVLDKLVCSVGVLDVL